MILSIDSILLHVSINYSNYIKFSHKNFYLTLKIFNCIIILLRVKENFKMKTTTLTIIIDKHYYDPKLGMDITYRVMDTDEKLFLDVSASSNQLWKCENFHTEVNKYPGVSSYFEAVKRLNYHTYKKGYTLIPFYDVYQKLIQEYMDMVPARFQPTPYRLFKMLQP